MLHNTETDIYHMCRVYLYRYNTFTVPIHIYKRTPKSIRNIEEETH